MWPACQQPLPTRSFIHRSQNKFIVRYQSAKEAVKRSFEYRKGIGSTKSPAEKNSKHEIRNSKQIQMTKIFTIPNKLPSTSVFWIFPIWDLCLYVCFGFGYSDFGLFRSVRNITR
jgi:hypothetical protein